MARGMPGSSASSERAQWIIQADLPARQVEFNEDPRSRRLVPGAVVNTGAKERERRLQALFAFLSSKLAKKPILLRSAGAVSVSATPEELTRISKHPLIKRIEPNRRLPKSRSH
jgi:hypothetical protein